ncbi:methyltransferase [Myceligenerans crystallogenes]|uniref:Phenazine-1-carboxylate N-methyltransferase PhzM n=1 Tax=Myceligenerans crystallogenes TaxID=316335 RepID=A0ABN2N8T5_9MICO
MADTQVTREVIEMITGGWRAQALYAAVRFKLPDHVAAGRTASRELAEETGADPEGIRRLMRLMIAMGVFEGDESGGYRSTRLSEALITGPGSLSEMCLLYGEEFYAAWAHSHEAVATAGSGFEIAFGEPLYEYLGDHDGTARRFQATMNAASMFFDRVPEVFDFTGGREIVDVGGGGGELLASILRATPDASGVLLEREHMIPRAKEHLAAAVGLDRVRLVGGDMFAGVPAGGNVYLLSRVLAGWDDDLVVQVFANCRRGMAGSSSRLLVLDRFVDDDDPTLLPALWDLHLLMTTGGRHRTLDEISLLLDRAGLVVERVAPLPMDAHALVAAPILPAAPVAGR